MIKVYEINKLNSETFHRNLFESQPEKVVVESWHPQTAMIKFDRRKTYSRKFSASKEILQ